MLAMPMRVFCRWRCADAGTSATPCDEAHAVEELGEVLAVRVSAVHRSPRPCVDDRTSAAACGARPLQAPRTTALSCKSRGASTRAVDVGWWIISVSGTYLTLE